MLSAVGKLFAKKLSVQDGNEIDRARRLGGEVDTSAQKILQEEPLARIPETFPWLAQLFRYAAVTKREARALVVITVSALGFSCFLGVALHSFSCALIVFAIVGLEYRWLCRQAFKRSEGFERDYTALLLSLASSVRTGLDPLVALCRSQNLFRSSSEVAKELAKLDEYIQRGMPEEQAIRHFAATINHPDVRLFQTAFILSRREGSSLSSCLQRLARVTRARQSFRRKVKSAVAMQKLSSIGIGGCAVLILCIQAFTSRESIVNAFHHPLGFKLLVGGGTLLVIGIVWMMRMVRPQI